MNKAEKETQNYVEKADFLQTYMKFAVAMTTSKMMDTIDKSKVYANDE